MNLKLKKLEMMALKFVSAGLMLIFISLFNEEASQWYQTRQPSNWKATTVMVASVIGFAASLESWLTAYDEMED